MKTLRLVLVLVLAGCAAIKNTPQQDYVWDIGSTCDRKVSFYKMERVEPDGRYWVRGTTNIPPGLNDYFGCMKEQFAARPFLDWVKAHNRESQQPPVGVGAAIVAVPTPSGSVAVPVWQVGDECEIAYRVSDLAFTLERVDGVIVSRDTPPRLAFDWPLMPGKSWEQSHRSERPVDRQITNRKSRWTVEAADAVTVPAGTFATLKITWLNSNTNATLYEMWYAPAVKQWIKIREILTSGIRERELIAFKLK